MRHNLTEKQFLARCKVAYRKGLGRPEIALLMRDWLDAVMRYEHTMFSPGGQTQGRDWLDFLKIEDDRTSNGRHTLANDSAGYALQEIAAVFAHPCQRCAENPDAWHTRPGFCGHKPTQDADASTTMELA